MAFDIVIGRQKKDLDKYGTAGTIFLGKQYVQMGATTSLSNNVYVDMATSHVIFVAGKRGGGKCLEGDTRITLNDGREVSIKDLEYNDNEILALNKKLKIQNASKSDFFKRKVDELVKIRLRSGKELKLTPEHPLLTINGWLPVEYLDIGGRIATPRITANFGVKDLDESHVKILAYLIAEGHLVNNFILFSNLDQVIVHDFMNAVDNFDSSLEVKTHNKAGCYRVVDNSRKQDVSGTLRDKRGRFVRRSKFDKKNSLRKFVEQLNLYDRLVPKRELPSGIFELPKSRLSLFINRLFSCNGMIYYDKNTGSWRISYASASRKLIYQVQSLLLKFGILAKARDNEINGFSRYELELRSINVYKYINEIGFYGSKVVKQKKALREIPRTNLNADTVPKEVWKEYSPESWAKVKRGMDYAHPKALDESIHCSPSRQKLLQIAKLDGDEEIERLANSDIFWDEIVEVEKLHGEFEVYDISVPEHHNFVANGVIVHNSYTMGVIAEGVASLPLEIKNNLAIILLDTMGVYWTMKYPNHVDESLLKEWGLEPQSMDVKIFTPSAFFDKFKKQGIPTDEAFAIRPVDVTAEDWSATFNVDINSSVGVLLSRAVAGISEKSESFSIKELVEFIKKDVTSDEVTKNVVISQFLKVDSWGIFAKEGTPLKKLAAPGQITVLDMSPYATLPSGWLIKQLAVGLISKRLFVERMISRKNEEFSNIDSAMHYFSEKKEKLDNPLVWLILDEAHELLPSEGKTTATDPLVTILREGRQPGISLILATQQPGKIHTDVMTQSDIFISHRITAKLDVDALQALTQTYMREGLAVALGGLSHIKGAAIVFDDVNERIFPIQVRPRLTWHGGAAPTALFALKKKI